MHQLRHCRTYAPSGRAFRSLTLISTGAHQCGLQIVPSRCPSVRPAVCAVQVPISAACSLRRPGAHQCGLQFAPSRCPSVRPAVYAVQVPIDANFALQSGEGPGLYGCSAHDASWSLGIFWMRLPIRAAPMAPHGSPRGLGALEPGSVRVEIRNLCGLKNP